MFSGVAVALPMMGTELHADAVSLGLVETLFLGSQLAFLLPMGRLADSSDKKTLYKFGLLGFGVSSLVIALVSSLPLILALRFFQGITTAICAATGAAILAELVPAGQRGKAYGSSIGAIYAGLALGPFIAGYMSDAFGWRAVFLSGAAVLLLVGILNHCLMPSKWQHPPPQSVHLPSTLLMVVSVLCLVLGSSFINHGLTGIMLITSGIVLATLLLWWQKKLAKPLLDVTALMRNLVLRHALFVQLLLYFNAACTVFMLSVYMQVTLGHSARVAGQILALGTVLMVVAAPLSGRLADRFPPQRIASFGLLCVFLSAMTGTQLSGDSSLTLITAMFTLQGLGFAFFSSPNMAIIMNSVQASESSMASALAAKSRSLGIVCGMLITSILISFHFGGDSIAMHPTRFVATLNTTYIILACLTGFALATSLRMREGVKRERLSD
jgi:MFS family permease